jgi:signal transduction histidine kinase
MMWGVSQVLHEFVTENRDELIRRCREKVALRSVPPPTEEEIDFGIPLFLEQLVDALRLGGVSTPEIRRSALLHGHELLTQGFTVSQVVHDYGDVCQSITELAVELKAPISTDDFRTLNACLDDAIAVAVTQYAHEKDETAVGGEAGRRQIAIDDEAGRGNARLGYLAHELRNLLHTALLASEALKSGRVGIAGSTGDVLSRSLRSAADLISDSLESVRVTRGLQTPECLLVSSFMDDLKPAATLAAEAAGIRFTLEPGSQDWSVEADPQVLTSVVMNLLQNAFKFTKPGTDVTLRVLGGAGRVLFEVEDRCGGLPAGNHDELFKPFEQRAADRSGLGLGLSFSRWAIEGNKGRIYARSLPGVGCIFTIDLPQCAVPSLTAL